ncbi:MAG: hypothetical protein KME13_24320 [Myxacorys californica WJT36-NPBG1]|jgi:hypothetical protein|nr:hypothetical protein [Myxacorys californica WJT36-NPBG1]
MKESEKDIVQKAINRIQDDNFDEAYVRILFITLREYSRDSYIFKEVADLIAHNKERNQGIVNDALENFYSAIKYFFEYTALGLTLDFSKPFPLHFKKLMHYQVSKCDESVLQTQHKVTKHKLDKQIQNLFKENRKDKTACLNGKIKPQTHEAIKFVMGAIYCMPSFSQEDIINQIVAVLHQNCFEFDEAQFRSKESKITLCILLLFHKTSFKFNSHKLGYSNISCDKPSIAHNVRLVDSNGNEVRYEETFGNLQISGNIILDTDGKDLQYRYPLISTNLKVEDWCDETLFSIEPLNQDNPDFLWKRVHLDSDLFLNNDFKLSRRSP